MRSLTKYGLAATTVAAAMTVAPLPAMAAESTGDVTVTRFDDRYADGLFDPSKTARDGRTDSRNTDLPAWLVAADGTSRYASADANGDYVFADVPVGPAKVYLLAPNSPSNEAFFDATGATSGAEIERVPVSSYQGSAAAEVAVTVDADGEQRLIGMTALRLAADVRFADGSVATGLAGIEFGSGSDWFAASEYQFTGGYGTYEAFTPSGYVRHIPDQLGVRITPPADYRVAAVTADDGGAIEVTARDGGYWIDSAAASSYFSAPKFTIVLEAAPDTERPQTTLVSPTTAGPFRSLAIAVDATDNRGLDRIVANIYKDGKLVKSTQTAVNGAKSGSHSATVTLPDGNYVVRYNSSDLAGNVSKTREVAVTIDATAPVATVKDGSNFAVKSGAGYDLISFKLSDAGKIDKVTINGKVKDLTNNAWSDVNFIKPGTFGAVKGQNTIVIFDVAGNTTTKTFTLN